MSEFVLALVADYGLPIIFCVTFLSCLAVPIPSSLLMLASGGFAATGDLVLSAVLGAAFCGAVLGDNTGYWIARGLGDRLHNWLENNSKRAVLHAKAQVYMAKRGGVSIFFSCWLFAPLGPYVNYISGLTRFRWFHFAAWGVAGEFVWVGAYVGLGYLFADDITALASLLGNISGLLVGLLAVIGLGYGWWKASKPEKSEG